MAPVPNPTKISVKKPVLQGNIKWGSTAMDSRSADSLHLGKATEEVLGSIAEFYKSENWYLKHQIPRQEMETTAKNKRCATRGLHNTPEMGIFLESRAKEDTDSAGRKGTYQNGRKNGTNFAGRKG